MHLGNQIKIKIMSRYTANRSLFFLFRQGFLAFFFLDKNPIKQYAKEQKEINDTDKIRMDWYNVGNDIKNAYEKYKQAATR